MDSALSTSPATAIPPGRIRPLHCSTISLLLQLGRDDLESLFTGFPSCIDHLDDSRTALATAYFARLAEFDPEAAFRRAIQLSIKTAPKSPGIADDPFTAQPQTSQRDPVDQVFRNAACQGALLVWSQRDWRSAVDAAFQALAKDSLSDSSVYAVLAQVALKHPVELIDHVVAAHPGKYNVRPDTILRGWGSHDPQAALDWVHTHLSGPEQSSIYRVLLRSLDRSVDPRQFPGLVRGILGIEDFHEREDALIGILQGLGRRDAAAAFEVLAQIPQDQLSESLLAENAFWMAHDPAATAPLIERLPSSPARTRLIHRHAATMAQTDPAQANDAKWHQKNGPRFPFRDRAHAVGVGT